ncbi:hypothetical protein TrRE_jg9004 [Triparma retinervis]|uniref:Coclaurine N-methyltransferase n=1 Tax=Triparma retinervis TaxID=2557542 RepID=A0A9W6ZTZ1_9STRA|nr:hypothetical protein TrRE_jg9004 [Triparma retinervis]
MWFRAMLVAYLAYSFGSRYLLENTSLQSFGLRMFELGLLPDFVTRAGIRSLIRQRRDSQISVGGEGDVTKHSEYLQSFIGSLLASPIAVNTADANYQHYEVPATFYEHVLGGARKYSSALYPPSTPVGGARGLLDEAEVRMLELYASRAEITREKGPLRVMDLGCGWGSVSLWLAANFPNVEVVGLSNSNSQRKYIMGQARERGITNLEVLTGNINDFELPEGVGKFDRVISIEMFEHMKNYSLLLSKISRDFLLPSGYLFVHIFVHSSTPYHFVDAGPSDWMTRHFFSGGTMPSSSLLLYFQGDLSLKSRWSVNGDNYALTSEAWLQNMDANSGPLTEVLGEIYGQDDREVWRARWRAFFMACAELFRFNGGNEWYVDHYLFENGKHIRDHHRVDEKEEVRS